MKNMVTSNTGVAQDPVRGAKLLNYVDKKEKKRGQGNPFPGNPV